MESVILLKTGISYLTRETKRKRDIGRERGGREVKREKGQTGH